MGYYKAYLYQDAITWTTDGANAGTVNYRAGKFYCTNVCGVLLSKEIKANQMIAEALSSVSKGYVSYVGNPKLMNNVMAGISIQIPAEEVEREELSYFLTNLDNLITLHQRKYDKLVDIKKSMLEKMFPKEGELVPEIRFAGFTDAWEQYKLANFLQEYNDQCEKGGLFEHVSLTKEGVVPKSKRYDRDSLVSHEDKKYRVTNLNDICYNPANLKFGVICRNKLGPGIFSPIYVTFRVVESSDPIFIEYLLKRDIFIQEALSNQEGTVYERMAVKPTDLLAMPVRVPSKEEQILIGASLNRVDSLITLHQRKQL